MSCGVPQGTILGSLLFLMYINDLPNCLESCTASRYADDTRLTNSGAQLHDIEGLMNRLKTVLHLLGPQLGIYYQMN